MTTDLAFCKKGDEGWTIIEDSRFYDDVIYYKGMFYAVHRNGSFASFDVNDPSPSMKSTNLPPTPIYRRVASHADDLYLVDSFGELLIVYRWFGAGPVITNGLMVYETNGFKVMRLNSKRKKWVKVESLGDRMLFLGSSLSVCLLATDFSGYNGNCIYFTGEFYRHSNNGGPGYWSHDSGEREVEKRVDRVLKPP